MQGRYEQQMKKGVLEMLVLKQLEKEERYGYQLISQLRDKSGGLFALKEGTLYPILYRLEDDGLVVSRWRQPQGKEVSRKYYVITEEGKEGLKELSAPWRDFSGQVSKMMEEEV